MFLYVSSHWQLETVLEVFRDFISIKLRTNVTNFLIVVVKEMETALSPKNNVAKDVCQNQRKRLDWHLK
uniref:Uncharacterized protein n=1 Tax=Acrobeloides nanus TaxID=290746 RepID=A0A914CII4_9BILA